MKRLTIDVWSDIACPWCYVGKRRLEAALARFADRSQVDVTWRAFELDPSAPRVTDPAVPYAQRLAQKYGSSLPVAQARLTQMTELAAQEGLEFHFERVRPGNTFDAHRLLHLAHVQGRQDAVKEALFYAYLTEGRAIGDREVLHKVAVGAGLDEEEVVTVLQTDAYADEVRADQRAAQARGIRGVPFFVVSDRYGLSGAQPSEVLLEAIERAWRELPDESATSVEGAACGPAGCT